MSRGPAMRVEQDAANYARRMEESANGQHHGTEWTSAEWLVVDDRSLTRAQAAAKIGRSWAAVKRKRELIACGDPATLARLDRAKAEAAQ